MESIISIALTVFVLHIVFFVSGYMMKEGHWPGVAAWITGNSSISADYSRWIGSGLHLFGLAGQVLSILLVSMPSQFVLITLIYLATLVTTLMISVLATSRLTARSS